MSSANIIINSINLRFFHSYYKPCTRSQSRLPFYWHFADEITMEPGARWLTSIWSNSEWNFVSYILSFFVYSLVILSYLNIIISVNESWEPNPIQPEPIFVSICFVFSLIKWSKKRGWVCILTWLRRRKNLFLSIQSIKWNP